MENKKKLVNISQSEYENRITGKKPVILAYDLIEGKSVYKRPSEELYVVEDLSEKKRSFIFSTRFEAIIYAKIMRITNYLLKYFEDKTDKEPLLIETVGDSA